MTSETDTPAAEPAEEEFDWDRFAQDLIQYVHLELAGQSAEALYPAWAFQIKTSEECQAAYYQELRRQTLARVDATALRQAQQLLSKLEPALPVAPAPDWLEQTIEHGRAWVEANTQRWRQVQLALGNLRLGTAGQQVVPSLMSEDRPATAGVTGALQVAPPTAGFELTLTVSPDQATTDPNLYQAEVMLTLLDHFGDYSGVDLYLMWDETTQQATTDPLGRAIFTALPSAQLKAMSLIVILPTET